MRPDAAVTDCEVIPHRVGALWPGIRATARKAISHYSARHFSRPRRANA